MDHQLHSVGITNNSKERTTTSNRHTSIAATVTLTQSSSMVVAGNSRWTNKPYTITKVAPAANTLDRVKHTHTHTQSCTIATLSRVMCSWCYKRKIESPAPVPLCDLLPHTVHQLSVSTCAISVSPTKPDLSYVLSKLMHHEHKMRNWTNQSDLP